MAFEVKNLTASDLNASDTSGYDKYKDVSLNTANFQDIGEYDVPSDVRGATWGGDKVYIELYDDSTTAVREDGNFRFEVATTGGVRHKVYDKPSRLVGASGQSATPTEWAFLPMGTKFAPPGGKLFLSFKTDAADTIDSTDCLFYSVPITLLR